MSTSTSTSTSTLNALLTNALNLRQLRVIFACFVVAMVDGFDTLMLAFIAPLLSQTWDLNHGGMGKLFGIGYLGAVVGGPLFAEQALVRCWE